MIRALSLRAKLLAVLVTLLALVCLVVGVFTVVELRAFLVGRLDASLVAAGGRTANAGGPPPDGGSRPTGAQFLLAPGQAAGTLGVRLHAGTVDAAGILQEDGSVRTVPAADVTSVTRLPTDGRPHTLAVGDLGRYRLLAGTTSSGDVLVTGLPLGDVDRTVDRLVVTELAVAGSAVVVAAGVGTFLVRRTMAPLRRVASTATRISALPLSQGAVAMSERVPTRGLAPRTEVGQVAGAVNVLLDAVDDALTARHASETRVRQFVADASHELRTPLTAIRGYAELTRRSRDQAPPDIARAMARVESEAARMTTLVEDLLLLARLDAGRPLARDPVDLTQLVVDAVTDAQVAGPEHRWRVDLPDEPVTVTGDPAGLHQVLANLLGNARVHTPPGTAVTTAIGTSTPGTAVVSVLDDGPGIPADVLPSVFDRFARGAQSRNRTAGSTGLGLAIVKAIVEAHHGSVDVSSRPGRTAFLIRLPT